MSGPEIQANAIETVRDGLPLPSPGRAGLAFDRVDGARCAPRKLRNVGGSGTDRRWRVGLLLRGDRALAFNGGLVLPVVYPLVTLAVSVVGTLAVHYVLSAFEREQVGSVFARFVPEGVVSEVMARTEDGAPAPVTSLTTALGRRRRTKTESDLALRSKVERTYWRQAIIPTTATASVASGWAPPAKDRR